ncbi:uncharacterized protein LOC122153606 [Tyto alba]|uniref:uncharacterized protein LOC122153606 n=1 Tax=Tyto alba TaxID=56313 RepID=UPI001C669467|nr:uncharacterized protein LOC122153606 [Tyto alba]XP_042649960.1 uncharacterized protein LOC122153606 [Tyto alba]
METPEATGAVVPSEVSPELLEPLVTVVAVLGELGATPGDVPLAGPAGSLRAGLVALVTQICRAMGHRHGEATRLRRALATTGDAWATVATVTREWREAVASVEATWATVAGDASRLRDACKTVATAGATTGVTMGHLKGALDKEHEARWDLLATTRALPVASELATLAEVVTSHRTRVAEASAGLQAATEATEKAAVATVGSVVARERGRRAEVAQDPLGHLVAACHGATLFYCHLRCRLEAIEATVAAGRGGPEPPGVAREGLGVPEDLVAAVAAAEALWDTSARLAKGHLLGTLRVVRGLLTTLSVPDATVAATVAQRCRDATAALPELLARAPQ